MWQIDLRRRLPVSGAYLVAPAGSLAITLTLAWQEGQQTELNVVDQICAQQGINDPNFRCLQWLLHP